MGPCPLSQGKYKYILVVCDHFTKYVEIFDPLGLFKKEDLKAP